MNKNTETPTPSNAFSELLRLQRKGGLMNEASTELQKLVQAVREHGKQGSLTITLKVLPANGDASAVQLIDKVSIKAPTAPPKGSMFYVTDDNQLSRNDPNQVEMELKVIEAPAQQMAAAK